MGLSIESHPCHSRNVRTGSSGFSADIARRVVGISYRQLDYWDKTGLVRPSIGQARGKGSRRIYSFEDLVELRVIAGLLSVGVSLTTVRKAAQYVRRHFADLVRPLARLTLVVDRRTILVRTTDRKQLVDATNDGQAVIGIAVAPIARDLRAKVQALQASSFLSIRVAGRAYAAVLTPDLAVGGYSIEVPELPGVVTEADTLAEARQMATDAIRLWLGATARVARRRSA
jgi:predicted RNase H-like HicB family nuclease/DNA-binding transcriptional MerR regulator